MLTKAWWRKESSQPWQKTSAMDTEQFCRNGSIQGMFRCVICGHVLTWVPASNTAPAYFQHEDSSADALCESRLNTSLPSTEGYSLLTCRLSKGKKNFRMEIGLPPLSEQAFLQALSLRLQFRIADHKGTFERYNLSEEPFAPEKTIWLPLPEDFARARIYALPAHACPPQWQCQPDFSRDALLFDADSGLLHPSGDDIRPGSFYVLTHLPHLKVPEGTEKEKITKNQQGWTLYQLTVRACTESAKSFFRETFSLSLLDSVPVPAPSWNLLWPPTISGDTIFPGSSTLFFSLDHVKSIAFDPPKAGSVCAPISGSTGLAIITRKKKLAGIHLTGAASESFLPIENTHLPEAQRLSIMNMNGKKYDPDASNPVPPDGGLLKVCSDASGSIELFDAAGLRAVWRIPCSEEVTVCGIVPGTKLVIRQGTEAVRVFSFLQDHAKRTGKQKGHKEADKKKRMAKNAPGKKPDENESHTFLLDFFADGPGAHEMVSGLEEYDAFFPEEGNDPDDREQTAFPAQEKSHVYIQESFFR